MNNLQIQLVS